MSRDIPIIFSAPMVRALLEGRKTMTRRLAWRPARKGEATGEGSRLSYALDDNRVTGKITQHQRPSPWKRVQAGDRLWVRENFSKYDYRDGCWYWADGREAAYDAERPRPSIHMPRWASRLTLIVTGTKVERLQDISEADAHAEGAPWYVYGHGVISDFEYQMEPGYQPNKRMGFCQLWNDLHGWGPPSAWESNPEVVAISFKVIHANIDAPEALAA
jgi:hypothetical protein